MIRKLSSGKLTFASAAKNRRVQQTIDLTMSLWKQARVRVQTSELNAAIEELKTRLRVGRKAAKRPKIYYAAQVETAPPVIVLFVNSPQHFSHRSRQFVLSFLRDRLPFKEVPIVVRYKKSVGRAR